MLIICDMAFVYGKVILYYVQCKFQMIFYVHVVAIRWLRKTKRTAIYYYYYIKLYLHHMIIMGACCTNTPRRCSSCGGGGGVERFPTYYISIMLYGTFCIERGQWKYII